MALGERPVSAPNTAGNSESRATRKARRTCSTRAESRVPRRPTQMVSAQGGRLSPVTAITNFERSASGRIVDVTLALYDPTKRDRAFLAHKERPLAANFGAPLA